MLWIPIVISIFVIIIIEFFFTRNWLKVALASLAIVLLAFMIYSLDISKQLEDTEVWSGTVVDWKHTEEWEEWIPPRKTCSTDVNGKESCITIPGYTLHHDATNQIKTSDNGWKKVKQSPDGRAFDDEWPNDVEELKAFWPLGTPTASKHTYVNKVNASYSIYKHEKIDPMDYPDLPDYPDQSREGLYIDRIVGDVPNKEISNQLLSFHNSRLNEMIPDPENPEKTRSWKQVNIIFVNVGENKTQDYGFALQDSWEGGNKNDFIISFSMNADGTLNWVYPFSWSEVELLKLEVRDYMMNLNTITDFEPIIEEVSKLVEEQFVRKQFADFDYLQVDVSEEAVTTIWFMAALTVICSAILILVEKNNPSFLRL